MSVVRWNPSRLIAPFSNLIDGFFDDNELFSSMNLTSTFPATNIEETDNAYLLTMAVPGLKKEDVNVEMDKNLLIISAEKEFSNEEVDRDYKRKEYSFKSFKRSFYLPENVNSSEIEANCKEGELTVEIPKADVELSKPKSIKVS